ncbi:DUF6483 family protein [Paenibacillus glacialis]|uniref:Uncharacterized protein n=1 Tax=Paenibacillus glacialis TaxID=494026 RepID=A0A162Q064_9BACL|nr:DUF6483 family protein [Paenibacillus glacialis]OAB40950.1 hypothetical protein PGLA_17255 [Paenibacillus glacialis]
MFRNDYILRMVEEMTQMISKVFDLKKERKHTEALWEIDELLSREFPLNSRLLNSLPTEEITEMFRFGTTVESDKLQGAAYLLNEEGKIYMDSGQIDEGLTRFMKSLHLYLVAELHGANKELIQLPNQVDNLLNQLKDYRLPLKTETLLFHYQEKNGCYAEAENALFRLLERDGIDPVEGLAFYERLQGEEDERLTQGRLPRAEVVEGLYEMQRRIQ